MERQPTFKHLDEDEPTDRCTFKSLPKHRTTRFQQTTKLHKSHQKTAQSPYNYLTTTDIMQSVLGSVIGPKEVHPENLDGRVAVVTGGALGIG